MDVHTRDISENNKKQLCNERQVISGCVCVCVCWGSAPVVCSFGTFLSISMLLAMPVYNLQGNEL